MPIKKNRSLFIKGLFIALSMLVVVGCSDDDVDSRLDKVEAEINNLKSAISSLQEAYDAKKHIASVEETTDDTSESTGWKIIFSDNTTVTIPAGTDNSSLGILEVIEDEENRTLVVKLTDGREFSFHVAGPAATSIILIDDSGVSLKPNGEAKILFRVNPSDADLNLDVESEDCQIALDVVRENSRSSLLVKESEMFDLTAISQSLFEDGTPIPGQYEATITDNGKTIGYSSTVMLVVAGSGSAQISSNPFTVSSDIAPEVMATGLPIVILNTPDNSPIVSKENWMKESQLTIYDKDGKLDYQGSLAVKGRGNSTWSYPKKPYALKLDKKSEILGMKKHKRWCLLANWMDRTMIRNAVAFEISRQTGLDYTPSGQFVELIVNGTHVGNYYLCEQIKVDENRVNVAELDPDATDEDKINGGYIFELDVYFDEAFKFRSEVRGLPWMFKDPDEVNDAQFNYIRNYVNEMEHALYDEESFQSRKFADYMDLESLVDWWFVYELSMNAEPCHPKSTYFHKDLGGKMVAGPVWDFDWGTFTSYATNYFAVKETVYYNKLFKDEEFVKLVKERWTLLKPRFESISDYIDGLKVQLAKSDEINAAMWPIGQVVNGDEQQSFSDAVDMLKSAYNAKLSWLDSQITAF